MSMIFFTYRASTQARQGLRVLQNGDIAARMQKTPAAMAVNGCGFSIKVPERLGRQAANLLRAQGSPFERVYSMKGDRVQEVRL